MLITSIASQMAALVRNVLVARYLGPSEFGIAAVIILTVAFLDSLSNAGTQNLLVQAKDDDDGELLATAHGISIVRGVLTTLLLVLGGVGLAHFTDVGLRPLSICLIAISCFVAGFTHRGVKSVQRSGDFVPDGVSQLMGELLALFVAVAMAMVTHSHVAIIVGIIARSAVVAATSHLLVKLPYKVSFSRDHMARFWTFGWPLLINGPLVFLSAQADRIFVSTALGAHSLGVYSAIVVLVSSPSTAILKWMGTIFLPPLSRFYHEVGRLEVRGVVYRYSAAMMVLAWMMLCGFIYFAPIAIPMLYGPKYATTVALVGLTGFLQLLRFLRSWPTTMALSVGASSSILISTIIRFLSLPIGLAGVFLIGGLEGLVAGFVVGETLALIVTLGVVNYSAGRAVRSGVAAVLSFAALASGAVWLAISLDPGPLAAFGLFLVTACIGSPVLAMIISPSEALSLVGARLSRLRH